ncbi:MAG TPA: hypothetical protein VHF22_15150, partial [Planctomycetota bacterium]|nr:hypothetical protein [Planctomycetota bacterium]
MKTLLALAVALLAAAGIAAAQDDAGTYVPRDDQLDALIRQSSELAAGGKLREAARALMRAEDRIDERLRNDSTARLVVPRPSSRDVFDGAERAIAERIAELPPAVGEAYRAERDPRAQELLDEANRRPADPAPL